jgi:glycosyltransferase involved in cell wall biosynthesis
MPKKNYVLLLGYSFEFGGGVSKVTNTICQNMNYVKAYPFLFCYKPKTKSIFLTVFSFFRFCLKLVKSPPKILHIVIGSKGDLFRTIPFIILGKFPKCSICIQFHKSLDVILTPLPNSLQNLIHKIWKKVDAFVFLSKGLRNEFLAIYPYRADTYIIPNVLNGRWYEREVKPLTGRSKDVVFLGRWSQEKGIHDLVALFSDLKGVSCHVYSNDSPSSQLSNMYFHVWVSEEEVKDVLSDSKALILPSYAEAYPTVLLEAAACGTPFVATSIAGIPDIAEESQAGFLADPGDMQSMREIILNLLNDEKLWQKCSDNGIKWMRQNPASNGIKEWEKLYKNLGIKDSAQ